MKWKISQVIYSTSIHIDLPSNFPEGAEVEVIVLPLSSSLTAKPDPVTAEWLRGLWACAQDFPDRLPDLPPEPVEIP